MSIFNYPKEQSPTLNEQFAEYLNAKAVAIVGPAHIDDIEQGDLIDSHDVVARVHQPFPLAYTRPPAPKGQSFFNPDFVPRYWHEIVGRKTSIYYTKMLGSHRSNLERIVNNFKRDGGEFICVEREANCWQPANAVIWDVHPMRYLRLDHFIATATLTNSKPLAGTLCICDILKHDIKSAYITGFPCWVTSEGTIENQFVNDNWQPWNDFNFLKKLSTHPDISFDPHMTWLFEKYGAWVEPVPNTDSPIQAGIVNQ